MPEQIYIGNFAKGLTTDRLPFVIDNDAFPTTYNFYVWRGRAKRKRGTVFLGRLQRQIEAISLPFPYASPIIMTLDGSGNGSANLISLYSLGSSASITPGTIQISDGTNSWEEPSPPDGTLIGTPSGSGTINYTTGAITISGGDPGADVFGRFDYFSALPVMGLRDFVSSTSTSLYPLLLAFDTDYSYQISQAGTPFFYNTTFYKISQAPFTWTGQDYQQFWTENYAGALWATNGVPGFHFVNATYTSGSGSAVITFNFKSGGVNYANLQIDDKLFFNEWSGGSTINTLSGTVTDVTDAVNGNYVVTFASSQTVAGTGIAQLLTASIPGQDGIKWYDGDPTAGTGVPSSTGLGWVNFAPPLTALTTSIDDTPAAKYYLVGALIILSFKDRLLFFSPTIQTSVGSPITLTDVVIWSWNGTPYYTDPVPAEQTSDPTAYYVDQTGKGGWLSAGISQPILTVTNNEDVLLVGFGGVGRKTRFVYTGNDLQPFLFFNINSELPSSSTFSAVTLDKGAIDIGAYGITMTDQQSCQRVDLQIPDSVFQVQALNNGLQRVNAVRDFYKEWIYFCYPLFGSAWKFPTQTLLYNYRDNTWGVQYENFTAHGTYRAVKKKTWATLPFKTWATWREPWNSGSGSPQFPSVIAGNPQGFILIKGIGTGEGISGNISAITNSSGNTQVTSTNHCVRIGDYLFFQSAIGYTALNEQIGKVIAVVDANNFVVDIAYTSGTYLGLGVFSRLSQPLLQTKQFPVYWDQGRQVRLSCQKYLMDFTANSQVTVNIYLSQDPDDAFNDPTINVPPNSLVYSQVMYTCPESANIGLTPANTNLQMPTAFGQYQIWHRFNTSLIGNTFQIGITLSDAQMRNLTYATSEITLHGMHLTVDKGPHLA